MDTLYKVVPIEGKGLGCVALKDIKMGTIILEEKPQMVINEEFVDESLGHDSKAKTVDYTSLNSHQRAYADAVVEAFMKMSKDDQYRFCGLHNAYVGFSERGEKPDGGLLMSSIYSTNTLGAAFGIDSARFNHSCRPNAVVMIIGEELIQIIATTKIEKGQEITHNYGYATMLNREGRQEYLHGKWRFRCNCDRCQIEALEADDKSYARYQSLDKDVQELMQLLERKNPIADVSSLEDDILQRKKAIESIKEMYKIAKAKKADRVFLIKKVIDHGFEIAIRGYFNMVTILPLLKKKSDPREAEFKKDCEMFAKAGYQILKPFGDENMLLKHYKVRHLFFEEYFLHTFDGEPFHDTNEESRVFINDNGKIGTKIVSRIPRWSIFQYENDIILCKLSVMTSKKNKSS